MVKKGLFFLIMFIICLYSVNAIDVTSCQNIASEGYYDLTENINSTGTCIKITVSNVELDCHGFEINHSLSVSGYGIDLDDNTKNNITIRNCYVYDAGIGGSALTVSTTHNSYFINNTLISYQSGDTLAFWDADNNIIVNNTISQHKASYDGIYIIGNSKNNTISYNTVNVTTSGDANTGVHIDTGDDSIISHNEIYIYNHANSMGFRLQNDALNNVIYDNYIYSELGYAVKIQHATATGNMFYNNLLNSTLGELDAGTGTLWNYSGVGNFYARIAGNGFSQNASCDDSNDDGICDNSYTIPGTGGNVDYYSLSSYPFGSGSAPSSSSSSLSSIFPLQSLMSIVITLGIVIISLIFN